MYYKIFSFILWLCVSVFGGLFSIIMFEKEPWSKKDIWRFFYGFVLTGLILAKLMYFF